MLLNKGKHIKGKTVLAVVTIVNNPYTIFVLTVLNSLSLSSFIYVYIMNVVHLLIHAII